MTNKQYKQDRKGDSILSYCIYQAACKSSLTYRLCLLPNHHMKPVPLLGLRKVTGYDSLTFVLPHSTAPNKRKKQHRENEVTRMLPTLTNGDMMPPAI